MPIKLVLFEVSLVMVVNNHISRKLLHADNQNNHPAFFQSLGDEEGKGGGFARQVGYFLFITDR